MWQRYLVNLPSLIIIKGSAAFNLFVSPLSGSCAKMMSTMLDWHRFIVATATGFPSLRQEQPVGEGQRRVQPAAGMFCTQVAAASMKLRGINCHSGLERSTKMANSLAEGSKAPDFALPSTTGGTQGPSNYAGQSKLVIAFYPKDNTSG